MWPVVFLVMGVRFPKYTFVNICLFGYIRNKKAPNPTHQAPANTGVFSSIRPKHPNRLLIPGTHDLSHRQFEWL